MTVYETDVPGVGKKFEVEIDGQERLVIVMHHDGKRELFHKPDPDADAERLFTISGRIAREIGAIIQGAYFQPVEVNDVEVPLGDAIIEWVDIEAESAVAGDTIGETDLRQETGASVIAIQRDGETLPNPAPQDEVRVGDILVALGTREELDALESLVAPDS